MHRAEAQTHRSNAGKGAAHYRQQPEHKYTRGAVERQQYARDQQHGDE